MRIYSRQGDGIDRRKAQFGPESKRKARAKALRHGARQECRNEVAAEMSPLWDIAESEAEAESLAGLLGSPEEWSLREFWGTTPYEVACRLASEAGTVVTARQVMAAAGWAANRSDMRCYQK